MVKNQAEYEYFASIGEFWYKFTELELYVRNMAYIKKESKNLDKKGLKDIIKTIDSSDEILNKCFKQLLNIASVRNYLFHNGVLDPVNNPISANFISLHDEEAYNCDLKNLNNMIQDIETISNSILLRNNQIKEKHHSDLPPLCSYEINWKYSYEKYQGIS